MSGCAADAGSAGGAGVDAGAGTAGVETAGVEAAGVCPSGGCCADALEQINKEAAASAQHNRDRRGLSEGSAKLMPAKPRKFRMLRRAGLPRAYRFSNPFRVV